MKPSLLLIPVLCLSACTIAPPPVEPTTIAYDGNSQSGGFLGYLADGSGHISPTAFARYAALLKAGYARGLVIPIPGPAEGLQRLQDSTWSIDRAHLSLFIQMNSRFKSGYKP